MEDTNKVPKRQKLAPTSTEPKPKPEPEPEPEPELEPEPEPESEYESDSFDMTEYLFGNDDDGFVASQEASLPGSLVLESQEVGSQEVGSPSQHASPPATLQSVPFTPCAISIERDGTLDDELKKFVEDLYKDFLKKLYIFFNVDNIQTINDSLQESTKLTDGYSYLQINTSITHGVKLILEINKHESSSGTDRFVEKLVHISLFPNSKEACRGIHISSDKNSSIKSRLYIKHIFAEDALRYGLDTVNKVISIIFKSVGQYFITRINMRGTSFDVNSALIKFLNRLENNNGITLDEIEKIGMVLQEIGNKYDEYDETLTSGGMKIMKYNKVVEKSNSKNGKNTLVNNKELKINKIKDKIKILKQDKIKNKDKIIKQIKLIEDIKTKIKIEKERAKQKHKEKASIIKRKVSVSKTTKTTTAKPKTPKTTTAKPKTTATKPKTPKTPKTTTAKPKTTTTKPKTPKTPKTTTAKPKTPKTTTAKPKTTTAKPKTTTAKPKTTTAKPKTTKRQANK